MFWLFIAKYNFFSHLMQIWQLFIVLRHLVTNLVQSLPIWQNWFIFNLRGTISIKNGLMSLNLSWTYWRKPVLDPLAVLCPNNQLFIYLCVFILIQALHQLQKDVEAIETEDGIKLTDVCSKPLFPRSSLCNIQVLTWNSCQWNRIASHPPPSQLPPQYFFAV